MAILWRGIGGADRSGRGRGRGRVWGKNSNSLVKLLVADSANSGISDELAKAFFLDVATGGGAAVFVGTTSITFGQSGTFTAGAALSGATSLAFGQTGSLLASTALTGTTPLTFSQTGDFTAGSLAGNADFVGTSTLVFGQTGVLAAGSAFTGSIPLTFSQSGALSSGASLSGTSTIAFGQSGSLQSGAGLQGTTALNFALSGDFVAGSAAGNAVFVGTTTITFGFTGDFTAGSGTQPNKTGYIDGLSRRPDEQKKRLEEIVEAAFDRVVAPGAVPTQAAIKTVVKSVRQEVRLDGLQTALTEIRSIVNQYAAYLKKQADDEDDVFAFMMMG